MMCLSRLWKRYFRKIRLLKSYLNDLLTTLSFQNNFQRSLRYAGMKNGV